MGWKDTGAGDAAWLVLELCDLGQSQISLNWKHSEFFKDRMV